MKFFEQKVLPYSPEDLFDIVLDIDKYQDFLPWCRHSEVIDHLLDQQTLYASVTVGYLVYSEMYVSKVTYDRPHKIQAEYVDGPFKDLRTTWLFRPHKQGCDLVFDVTFEFNASLLNAAAEHVLDHISHHMVQAFIQRSSDLLEK